MASLIACRRAARGILSMREAIVQNPRRDAGRNFTHELSDQAIRQSFAIAFDIDGVLLRGGKPIPGAPGALRRLYDHPAAKLRIPYIFLTNGGGSTEASRATELSKQLGVPVLPDQVTGKEFHNPAVDDVPELGDCLTGDGSPLLLVLPPHTVVVINVLLGHTPFRNLAEQFKNQRILAIGKGEPDAVLKSYGFEHVIHMDSYVDEFENIDGLSRFKPWLQSTKKVIANPPPDNLSQIAGVFVVSDPVEWSRDMQVICDVLRSGGKPGREVVLDQPQPPLFFAADDIDYQSTFPIPRLGMGAFRVALESIYNRLPGTPLQYVSYGKPQLTVYKYAERVLEDVLTKTSGISAEVSAEPKHCPFKTIYMIGDNPSTDILGAKFAGRPWFSILTRTGCYRGQSISSLYQPDKVVDDVEEAVDFIIQREIPN